MNAQDPRQLQPNRMLIVSGRSWSTDVFEIYDLETQQPLFRSSEPDLDGPSKMLRFLGAGYAKMAAVDYRVVDAKTKRPALRILRAGKMIGFPPPFEISNGADQLLARFKTAYGFGAKQLKFTDTSGSKLFDLTIKQRSGFVFSVKALSYDLLVDGVPFASLVPYKQSKTDMFPPGRARLLEIERSADNDSIIRTLIIGVALSLDRIMQHRHN